MNYITLHQVKEYMKLLGTTTDDALFQNWINWSCELIEYWKGRRYDVYQAQYMLDLPKQNENQFGEYGSGINPVERLFSKRLYLDVAKYDLLEVIELLNGDGEEIPSNQYILEPNHLSKKNRIKIKEKSSVSWKTDEDGNTEQVISLTGFFGFNRKYPNCFVDTKLTLSSEINASVPSFSISDLSGKASDFLQPAIQIGNMLRLVSGNETEFLLVTDTDTDYEDVVYVERGFNGTEGIVHSSGTKIEVYRPDGDIVQMALQLVRWRYRNKDVDNFDRTFNLATQTATTPSALPADVRMILGSRKLEI